MSGSCALLKCLKACYDKINNPVPVPVKLARELHKNVLLLSASEITEGDYEPLSRFLQDPRVVRSIEVIVICRATEPHPNDKSKMTVKQLRNLETANHVAHRFSSCSSRLMKATMLCIRQSKRIHTMVLHGLHVFEVDFVDMLGQAIRASASELRWLQLCSCNLRDAGVEKLIPHIANCPLQVLILERCAITDKGFAAVWRFIQAQEEAMDSKFWNATLRIEPPSALNTGTMGYQGASSPLASPGKTTGSPQSSYSPMASTRMSVEGSKVTNTLWDYWVDNQKRSNSAIPSTGLHTKTTHATHVHSQHVHRTSSPVKETDVVCNSGLVAFSINGNHISGAVLEIFVRNLSSNHWLLGVNLANNDIEDYIFPKMVESLSANNVLYALVLGGNGAFSLPVAEQLLEVMPKVTGLEGNSEMPMFENSSNSNTAASANVLRCKLMSVKVQELLFRWRSLQELEACAGNPVVLQDGADRGDMSGLGLSESALEPSPSSPVNHGIPAGWSTHRDRKPMTADHKSDIKKHSSGTVLTEAQHKQTEQWRIESHLHDNYSSGHNLIHHSHDHSHHHDHQGHEAHHGEHLLKSKVYANESMPELTVPVYFVGGGSKKRFGSKSDKDVRRSISPGVRIPASGDPGCSPAVLVSEAHRSSTPPIKRSTIHSRNNIHSPPGSIPNHYHTVSNPATEGLLRRASSGSDVPTASTNSNSATLRSVTPPGKYNKYDIPPHHAARKKVHLRPGKSSSSHTQGKQNVAGGVKERSKSSSPLPRQPHPSPHKHKKASQETVVSPGAASNWKKRQKQNNNTKVRAGSSGKNRNLTASDLNDARYGLYSNAERGKSNSSGQGAVSGKRVNKRPKSGRKAGDGMESNGRQRHNADRARAVGDQDNWPGQPGRRSVHIIGQQDRQPNTSSIDAPLTRVRARARAHSAQGRIESSVERNKKKSDKAIKSDVVMASQPMVDRSSKKTTGNRSSERDVRYKDTALYTSAHMSPNLSPLTVSDVSNDVVMVSHTNGRKQSSIPEQRNNISILPTQQGPPDKVAFDQLQEKLAYAMQSITKEFEHMSMQLQQATIAFAHPTSPASMPPPPPVDSPPNTPNTPSYPPFVQQVEHAQHQQHDTAQDSYDIDSFQHTVEGHEQLAGEGVLIVDKDLNESSIDELVTFEGDDDLFGGDSDALLRYYAPAEGIKASRYQCSSENHRNAYGATFNYTKPPPVPIGSSTAKAPAVHSALGEMEQQVFSLIRTSMHGRLHALVSKKIAQADT